MADSDYVVLGRVSGVFGTRGWLKIHSYTRPRDGIFEYAKWHLSTGSGWREFAVSASKAHGNGLIAALAGVDDRDAAVPWVHADIAVLRSELPPNADGEYYWTDLIGTEVVTTAGVRLGKVVRLLDTGASDVMVVHGDRERLIPFVVGHYVMQIDLDSRRIVVDWHPED